MDPLSAGKRAVSAGASAARNMRAFVGRSAKVTAPITMICGAIADLASTIAAFAQYLLILCVVLALVSGLLWFLRYRREYLRAAADGVMQPDEVAQLGERNAWSITFAASVVGSVVMGGFVLAQNLAGAKDQGVLAATVPGMDALQASLFRVERKVEEVKQDTAAIREDTKAVKSDTGAIKEDTAKLVASVEEIARRFDALSGRGGLITEPRTPEEHYHNARIQELGGNFSGARKSYLEFLQANLEVLDPWLNYIAMLKVQEGKAGAVEAVQFLRDRAPVKTVSAQTAAVLLQDAPARRTALEKLAADHAEFGPLAYLVSQEYSDAKLGDVTLADQRMEREWLEKFRAANESGKFVKYILDKEEAQKWIETADQRWKKLTSESAKMLDTPVSLVAQQSGAGWGITFTLADYTAKELFFRLNGAGDFQSTGHLPNVQPQTGRPMINPYVPLPNLPPGEHAIEVRYTDRNDRTNGPYTLKFSTADQQLAQGKMMVSSTRGSWLSFRDHDGKLLLYFTTLMTFRPIIKEIRYSLDSEALDQQWTFTPTDKMYEAGDKIFTSVPKDTQFACVQVTFKDGTKSAVEKYVRAK
jgi:hypothetical protein